MEQHGLTSNNTMYAGSTTNKLTISSVTNTMNGYKYRVKLDKKETVVYFQMIPL
jgi:hypothetical protein